MSEGQPSPFPQTQWTLVGRAGSDREALGALLGRYVPALEAHLLARRVPRDRIADLVQGFISDKIVEQNLLSRADRGRGKFRTFLLTAMQNYVIDLARAEQSQKRAPGGGVLHLDQVLEPACAAEAASRFDVAWAKQVIAETLKRMECGCRDGRRADVWTVFELRILREALHGEEPVPYEELVQRLGVASPTQAANLLITARRMFARLLREVIAEYAASAEDIEREIADLREILQQAGA